ncbi:hypothetical protein LTR94_031076, partial [Friedmanniomyces endolithicus]
MEALRAHRAQDLNEGMAQTQEMANLYRRESAQVKANPAAIAIAPEADRRALIEAVMSGVSAGVVSVGPDRTIKLVNSSATALLKTGNTPLVG